MSTTMSTTVDDVTALRALASARGMQPKPVYIVLDDELRDQLQEVNSLLYALDLAKVAIETADDEPDEGDEGDAPTDPGYLGEAPEPVDHEKVRTEQLASIKEQREAAEAKRAKLEADAIAANVVVCVNFHRLPPADYQAVVDEADAYLREHADEDALTPMRERLEERVKAHLPALCYHSVSKPDLKHDLGMTWDEVLRDFINHAELDEIRQHCVNINRVGATVDFRPVSSGPATQS
ncbi:MULTISPECIES: hypothetical protein [unclassified Luteococcus]|uniref:hypothetical protein n=1 Tax=unclassified Luteococcus TaxID=2639923 RepID=UPI00313B9B30